MARDSEYILTLLKEYGMVTDEQIASARDHALESEFGEMDIVDALVDIGAVNEDELLAMLAQQYGMEIMDLSGYEIPAEVIASLDVDIARHYGVIPVAKHDDMLTIAMSDPADMETLDTLRYLLGGDVDVVAAPKKQIEAFIERYYAEREEESSGCQMAEREGRSETGKTDQGTAGKGKTGNVRCPEQRRLRKGVQAAVRDDPVSGETAQRDQ